MKTIWISALLISSALFGGEEVARGGGGGHGGSFGGSHGYGGGERAYDHGYDRGYDRGLEQGAGWGVGIEGGGVDVDPVVPEDNYYYENGMPVQDQ